MDFPRIGVGVIIEEKGCVLLIQRKGAHGAGSWSSPGGHLEFGESPEQCAIRETKEEVGIEVGDIRFVAVTNDIFKESGKHYITLWMQADHLSGEPKIAAENEVAEVSWFKWESLPTPLFIPLENLMNQKSYPPDGLLIMKQKRMSS
jgi:8-oxo-dGTP diphosphatase